MSRGSWPAIHIVLISVTLFTGVSNLNPLYLIPLVLSQAVTAFAGVRLAQRAYRP